MSWEPRHDRLYKDGVLIQHRIQRTEGGEWEDYVEEKVELPKQSMRMKAFPTLADNGHITTQDGMDLRDYFAAKAMQAIISSSHHNEDIYKSVCATWAYEIADAMMKERESD